jgi:hypothetical protein
MKISKDTMSVPVVRSMADGWFMASAPREGMVYRLEGLRGMRTGDEPLVLRHLKVGGSPDMLLEPVPLPAHRWIEIKKLRAKPIVIHPNFIEARVAYGPLCDGCGEPRCDDLVVEGEFLLEAIVKVIRPF